MNWYKLAQIPEKTIILYHGTNSIALDKIYRDGIIKPYSIQDVLSEAFSRAGIDDDPQLREEFAQEETLRQVFDASGFGVGSENSIYLTPSKEEAKRFAHSIGGEKIRDVVHSIEDKYGKKIPIEEGTPVVITLELPITDLPTQYLENINLMEATGLSAEDLLDQVVINKPIPIAYIVETEGI